MDQYAGLIFLAIPLLLLYLVSSRSRKQQREVAAIQAALQPGLRVMTTSGLHAEIVSLADTSVVLEIAPGVHVTWARLAIAQVMNEATDQESAVDDDPAAVVDLTSDAARDSSARPSGVKDDNNLRSDDDQDDRTRT